MNPLKQKLLRALTFASLTAFAGATLLIGCGPVKSQDDTPVVIENQPQSAAAAKPTQEEEAVKQFLDLYKLFADPDGKMSRKGFNNLFKKFEKEITSILNGSGITGEQLINFMFALDSDNDSRVSPKEVISGVEKRIPFLAWYKTQKSLNFSELQNYVAATYPGGSPGAYARLASSLMELDQKGFGGNSNSTLEQGECVIAGLTLGLLQSSDISQGLRPEQLSAVIPGSMDDRLVRIKRMFVSDLLNEKLSQRIYGNYNSGWTSIHKISDTDRMMEYMRAAILGIQVDRLIRTSQEQLDSAAGGISPKNLKAVLSPLGFDASDLSLAPLMSFYDSPVAIGNMNGRLDTIEAFNLMLDYRWSQDLLKAEKVDLTQLRKVLPFSYGRFEESGLFDENSARFDKKEKGGNEDKKLDVIELTLQLDYMRSTDWLFRIYDKDQDGQMTKSEFVLLLKDNLQTIDEFAADHNDELKGKIAQVFFANSFGDLSYLTVNPNGTWNTSEFWPTLNTILRLGGVFHRTLDVQEFLYRFDRVMPILIPKIVQASQKT